MSWNGKMQVIVTNKTGGPIAGVSVSHQWTDGGTESTSVQSMALGESASFEIGVGSGGHDLWTVGLVDVSGRMWARQDKRCNVEEEDLDSGRRIYILLNPLDQGWSVQLPVSSSCIDNHYDDPVPANLKPNFNWNYDVQVVVTTALGMVPIAGSILSGLARILWPSSGADVWTQVEQQTAQLIQRAISEEVFQERVDDLAGLQRVLKDLLSEISIGGTLISEYWVSADTAFDERIPSFTEKGYEQLLLPLFAQVANLELCLLRDGVLFGKGWGWGQSDLKNCQDKLTKNISCFQQYVDTCYQNGYQQVEWRTEPNWHYCEPFRSVNQYVREMTLSVMDVRNLWPYLDPSIYPHPVTPYLDREIYSDPVGTCDNSGAIKLPSPPAEPILQMAIWGGDRIDAAQLTYPAGGGPGGVTQTPRMGTQSGGTPKPPGGGVFTLTDTVQVVEASGQSGNILNALSFTFSDGTQTGTLGGTYPGGSDFSFSYPGETMSSLHINGVSSYYGSADCAVFGFKYQGYGPLSCTTLQEGTWTIASPVDTISTPATPSVVEYNGLLYCAHQGGPQAGSLWCTTFDGTAWSADTQVANVGMSDGPSLAVYNGMLYVAHQGWGGNGQLWYSVFDGSSWQQGRKIENVSMSGSPSLVVFNNELVCMHQGWGGHGELWYSVFDGSSWHADARVPDAALTGSPSAVVFKGHLYCFYQGAGGDGELWYSVFDGSNWQSSQMIQNVGISESPAAVLVDDALYVLHKGWGTSTELWYSVFDGTSWQPDTRVSGATLASSPSTAVFDGILYCLYRGAADA